MQLKLGDLVALNYELNGISKQNADGTYEQITKGLLNQKISFKVKVYLQRLNKIVSEEAKLYEDTKNELFRKYGELKEGRMTVLPEHVSTFTKEFNELVEAEKDIDPKSLWGDDLTIDTLSSIETDEVYPTFMKLID